MNSGDLKMERHWTRGRQIRRIGLISPYSGGNLGNAAIISATITNIKKRVPGAEILGITLSPEVIRRRHGIEGFPLAAVSRRNYALVNSETSPGKNRQRTTGLGIKQLLKKIPLLGRALSAISKCSREFAHIAGTVRAVGKLDCVVIPGGGALDDFWGGAWGQPWALFKFAVVSRVCHVPFLFVSVGKCSLEHPLSRFFIRTALRLAEYRSYRDQDSKKSVQELLNSPHDPVCPDLAYSYPQCSLPRPSSHIGSKGRLIVGVSPIAYCDPRIWPLKDEHRYLRYLQELGQMVNRLIGDEHKIVLFATDSPDCDVITDLQAILRDSHAGVGSVEVLPGPPEQTTDSLLQSIGQMDVVIASRLHGVILSHLLAIPVLAISYDRKVDAHMGEIGQGEHRVQIDHLEAGVLMQRFKVLSNVRERESTRLRHAVQAYREKVDAQYDLLLGSAESGCKVQTPLGPMTAVES